MGEVIIVVKSLLQTIQDKYERLRRSAFVRNVSLLLGGTAVAQGLAFIALPVISRQYSPSVFGDYALFVTCSGIVSSVASLRYDQAVQLPSSEHEATILTALALIFPVLFGFLCLLGAVPLVLGGIGQIYGFPTEIALGLLGFSVVAAASSQLALSWTLRKKQFRTAALANIVRAITVITTQIVLGMSQGIALYLVLGYVVGECAALVVFTWSHIRSGTVPAFGMIRLREIRPIMREYSDFPKYNSAQGLMNSISQGIPAFVLMHFYGADAVGNYSMSLRVIQSPLNLVLTPVRQAFLQRTSELKAHGQDLMPDFRKMTRALIAIVAFPTLVIVLFAPWFFATILGAGWRNAGEYSRWLIIWVAAMFTNVPATVTALVLRKQRMLFGFDLLLLVSRTAALIVGGLLLGEMLSIASYSIVGFIFNVYLIVVVWRIVQEYHLGLR